MPRLRYVLTDGEAIVLALIASHGPLTAYEVRKRLSAENIRSVSASTGSIYPIIARLKATGLVQAEGGGDGRRSPEWLRCSPAGQTELANWLVDAGDAAVHVEDGFSTRLRFLNLLGKSARKRALTSMITQIASELERANEERAGTRQADILRELRLTTLGSRHDLLARALEQLR